MFSINYNQQIIRDKCKLILTRAEIILDYQKASLKAKEIQYKLIN